MESVIKLISMCESIIWFLQEKKKKQSLVTHRLNSHSTVTSQRNVFLNAE